MLTVLCGPAGCGKTTWASQQGGITVSSDIVRAEMGITDYRPEDNERVFALVHARIRDFLEGNADVIVDATHLRPEYRLPLKVMARGVAARARLVFFANFSDAVKQNAARKGRLHVPDDAMVKMLWQAAQSWREIFDEGWDEVLVIERPPTPTF